eukprot:6351527-Lingulodinium_polyedra.AAC.1
MEDEVQLSPAGWATVRSCSGGAVAVKDLLPAAVGTMNSMIFIGFASGSIFLNEFVKRAAT